MRFGPEIVIGERANMKQFGAIQYCPFAWLPVASPTSGNRCASISLGVSSISQIYKKQCSCWPTLQIMRYCSRGLIDPLVAMHAVYMQQCRNLNVPLLFAFSCWVCWCSWLRLAGTMPSMHEACICSRPPVNSAVYTLSSGLQHPGLGQVHRTAVQM